MNETGKMKVAMEMSLCDGVIEIAGRKLVPDSTKGYVEFKLSHSYPMVTVYGETVHPGTVVKSYQSLQDQVFNLNHMMKSYDKENITQDRILGTVVAVELRGASARPQWKLSNRVEDQVHIRGAAVIHKMAQGVDRILGEHQAGRHEWSVSMELCFLLSASGMLFERVEGKELFASTTPDEVAQCGLEYCPFLEGPEELVILARDILKRDMKKIERGYKGRRGILLGGGLNGNAHYSGVGLVRYGAEREAEVLRIAAEGYDEGKVREGLRGLAKVLADGQP